MEGRMRNKLHIPEANMSMSNEYETEDANCDQTETGGAEYRNVPSRRKLKKSEYNIFYFCMFVANYKINS
jgi:hypothetical protein